MSKSQRETRILRLSLQYATKAQEYRLALGGFYKREIEAHLNRGDYAGALEMMLYLASYVIGWEIRTGMRG